ncbi:MAG TPA: hemerythrin domain-containing protein [Actinopolymorphaceae bacterium]
MTRFAWVRKTLAGFSETCDLIVMIADELDAVPRVSVWNSITSIATFVERELLPYLMAEEEALYPAVLRTSESATRAELVRIDHDEFLRLHDELQRALRAMLLSEPRAIVGVRRVLYGLQAVLRLHVRAVEEVLLPILERRSSDSDVRRIESRMRRVISHEAATLGSLQTS